MANIRIIENDTEKTFMVIANNAAWCLGEMAVINPELLQNCIQEPRAKLIELMSQERINKLLGKTVALGIGKIGLADPVGLG